MAAHYIEINFAISIVVTQIYFWVDCGAVGRGGLYPSPVKCVSTGTGPGGGFWGYKRDFSRENANAQGED